MADKVTAELANAARRLLADSNVKLCATCDPFTEALQQALDAFDAREIEWLDYPPRLTAEKLKEIWLEERDFARETKEREEGMPGLAWHMPDVVELAVVNTTERLADYANHLSDTIVALNRECDLVELLKAKADGFPGGFDNPEVRRFAEVISALVSEVNVRKAAEPQKEAP